MKAGVTCSRWGTEINYQPKLFPAKKACDCSWACSTLGFIGRGSAIKALVSASIRGITAWRSAGSGRTSTP